VGAPIAAVLGYVLFAVGNPGPFKLMFVNERLDADRPALRLAASGAFDIAARAVAQLHGREEAMTDPVLVRRVIALWSMAHGLAALAIAEQLGPLGKAEKLARALVPDMVRELFGKDPVNDRRDLRLIGQTATAQRRS
jgi:hypothetical protein